MQVSEEVHSSLQVERRFIAVLSFERVLPSVILALPEVQTGNLHNSKRNKNYSRHQT
jgi:methionyl-tRNA formyltransferase